MLFFFLFTAYNLTKYFLFFYSGLAAHGLRPSDINYLILTHRDLDNIGNLNLFITAEVYSANRKVVRETFEKLSFNAKHVSYFCKPLIWLVKKKNFCKISIFSRIKCYVVNLFSA